MLLRKFNLQQIIYFLLKIIFVVIAMTVLLISLRYTSIVTMNTYEIPVISVNSLISYVIFILAVIAFILFQPILEKIDSKRLLVIAITLFFVIGLYLIYFSSTFLRQSDPKNCIEIAQHLNYGDYSDFRKENYLGWYPYQIYWISFLRPLLNLTSNIKFLYLLNIVYECIIFIIFYKITKLFTNKNSVLNNVILLSILFFPNLFNVLFVYGNIPGYMFFMLGVYFLIKVLKGERVILLMIFNMLAAYLIKNNYLIGIIALFIVVLITNLTLKKKILIFIGVLGSLIIITTGVTTYYSKLTESNFNVNGGIPKVAFVVMGLQGYKNLKNGWYDGYTLSTYKNNNYSESKTKNQARKDLKRRLVELEKSPSRTFIFIKEKLISTWADSTFQALWIAPWKNKGNEHLKYFYSDGKNNLVRIISCVIIQIIVTCGILNCFHKIRIMEYNDYFLMAMLFFIGGFLFHLVWETKSQYVWQYIETLIPVTGVELNNLFNIFNQWRKKYANNSAG